jgi:hypothetical protein
MHPPTQLVSILCQYTSRRLTRTRALQTLLAPRFPTPTSLILRRCMLSLGHCMGKIHEILCCISISDQTQQARESGSPQMAAQFAEGGRE